MMFLLNLLITALVALLIFVAFVIHHGIPECPKNYLQTCYMEGK